MLNFIWQTTKIIPIRCYVFRFFDILGWMLLYVEVFKLFNEFQESKHQRSSKCQNAFSLLLALPCSDNTSQSTVSELVCCECVRASICQFKSRPVAASHNKQTNIHNNHSICDCTLAFVKYRHNLSVSKQCQIANQSEFQVTKEILKKIGEFKWIKMIFSANFE